MGEGKKEKKVGNTTSGVRAGHHRPKSKIDAGHDKAVTRMRRSNRTAFRGRLESDLLALAGIRRDRLDPIRGRISKL